MTAKKKPAPVAPKRGAAPAAPAPKMADGGTIGGLIDQLAKLKKKKSDVVALAKSLHHECEAMEKDIIAALAKQKLAGGRGRFFQASITSNIVPNATDWNLIYAWALKKKDLSLFHRRLSSTHWGELVAAGIAVPGISPVTLTELSFTKVK